MTRAFRLPDLGEGLTEAEIIKVLVREGQVIQEDAPLLEVETDKAQVEIPSPLSGRVEKIHVQPGQTVRVGDVLVTFADDRESEMLGGRAALGSSERPLRPEGSPSPQPSAGHRAAASVVAPTSIGPVPATPATRRLARELGVDLRVVRGSGPGGRVTDDDVRAAAGGAPATGERRARRSASPPSRWGPGGSRRRRCPGSSSGARSSASRSRTSGGPSPSAWPSRRRSSPT